MSFTIQILSMDFMYCLRHDFGGTKPSQKNPLKVDILAHAYAQCRSNKGAPNAQFDELCNVLISEFEAKPYEELL